MKPKTQASQHISPDTRNVFFILFVLFVFATLLFIRVWKLTTAPPNVTGDEVTYLNDILRIFYSSDKVSPFSLMGVGSMSGINFYFMAFIIKLFPEEQAVLGMRVASSILSLAVLFVFFLYLRTKVALMPSLFATLLLGTNYVFLNFSRATWMADGHGLGLICVFLSFILVEKALESKRWKWAALAGATSGLGLYGYTTGVFSFAVVPYILFFALRGKVNWKMALAQLGAFLLVAFIVFLPQFVVIMENYDSYMGRARHVSIDVVPRPYYEQSSMSGILWHQVSYTTRGFILLDPGVGGEGLENKRYGPVKKAITDPLTRILFFSGLITLVFFHRKDYFLVIFALIGTLAFQILTEYPPNFARGIFAVTFIYLVVAVFLDKIWLIKHRKYLKNGLFVMVLLICIWNTQYYFSWGSGQELANARVYAIEYSQVPTWINLEKQAIMAGKPNIAITSQEWQNTLNNQSQTAR